MSDFAGTAAAVAIRDALARCNAGAAFGLPGSPNHALFQRLRGTDPRLIVPTHELAAAFMAGTFGRIDGRPGVLLTIPGPGFAFALPGIAEAWQDSAPLLHIVAAAPGGPHQRHRHQALEQNALARAVTKAMFGVSDPATLAATIGAAYETARDGEPGPVVVQLGEHAETSSQRRPFAADATAAGAIWRRILRARRPVLLLGQGCAEAAEPISAYAARTGTPVFTTASGRGIVPENSPWCLPYDSLRGATAALNALLGAADLVIAVGARLAYNGTAGFEWQLPPERLVHVDAGAENLDCIYPASATAVMRAAEFFAMTESQAAPRSGWSEQDIARWRARVGAVHEHPAEPLIAGGPAPEFFATLRKALPDAALVVTDSGLHQVMARRYFEVRHSHGLLLPTDLQSMGFGLPSALAARLAAPSRPVIALVGDGGMLMSGLELATAVRENIDLTVIVFNDGYLNQIRMQQLNDTGRDFGVTLPTLDFQALAASVGAVHAFYEPGNPAVLAEAGRRTGVTLIEVPVVDSRAVTAAARTSRVKSFVRRAVGQRAGGFLRRLLRR
ncbi:MAG: thiamine pyrophosphate-binding protein [Proteobacteria bacterium]|nr:thiamine pyrophosphate-binding protein [Pseudomonadota bacterium]